MIGFLHEIIYQNCTEHVTLARTGRKRSKPSSEEHEKRRETTTDFRAGLPPETKGESERDTTPNRTNEWTNDETIHPGKYICHPSALTALIWETPIAATTPISLVEMKNTRIDVLEWPQNYQRMMEQIQMIISTEKNDGWISNYEISTVAEEPLDRMDK